MIRHPLPNNYGQGILIRNTEKEGFCVFLRKGEYEMDITFPYKPATIAKTLYERIHSGVLCLENTDAASALEFLYIAYTDVQGRDPKEINQGFIDLDDHLEGIDLDKNNEIFATVCRLCSADEKRAFIDAVQIGASLMLELQGNKKRIPN